MKLTSVHDALQLASLETAPVPPMVMATFRVDVDTLNTVHDICERHGTTLSAFLRKCCEGMVQDYSAE